MRISDWSSDVCSSDLQLLGAEPFCCEDDGPIVQAKVFDLITCVWVQRHDCIAITAIIRLGNLAVAHGLPELFYACLDICVNDWAELIFKAPQFIAADQNNHVAPIAIRHTNVADAPE